MITSIQTSSEIKERLAQHIGEGEVFEDVIVRLLDLDDQYGDSEPIEFEVEFDEEFVKVFRLNNTKIEYFTPARKFSISLGDWNLPEKFREEWISFITSPEIVSVLLGLGEDSMIGCGCFIVRQI